MYKWVTTSQLFKGHTNYHLAKLQPKSKQHLKQFKHVHFLCHHIERSGPSSQRSGKDILHYWFRKDHNLLVTVKHQKALCPNNAIQVESRNESVHWFLFSRCQLVSSLVLWFTKACPASDLRSRLPAVNTCGREESIGGPKPKEELNGKE